GQTEVHAPLAALDVHLEIPAADLAVDARVPVAIEALGAQLDLVRRAQEGQAPLDGGQALALEDEGGGLEARLGKFADVQEIGVAQMLVERIRAAVDLGGVDANIGLAAA